MAVMNLSAVWDPELLPVVNWTLAQVAGSREQMPAHLRIALAELLLHRGERDTQWHPCRRGRGTASLCLGTGRKMD